MLLAGHSVDECVRGDIFAHHTARTDEAVFTQCDPADDGGIGSDGAAFFKERRAELLFALNECSWVDNVGEDHAGAEENPIFNDYAFVDGDVVLDFDLVTKCYIRANGTVLSHHALLSQNSAGHEVAEVPDFGA